MLTTVLTVNQEVTLTVGEPDGPRPRRVGQPRPPRPRAAILCSGPRLTELGEHIRSAADSFTQRIDRTSRLRSRKRSPRAADGQARRVCLNTLHEDVVRGRGRPCIVVVDRVRFDWRLCRTIGHVHGTGAGNDHIGGGSPVNCGHPSYIRSGQSAPGGTVKAGVRPALRPRRRRPGFSSGVGLLRVGALAHQRHGNQFRSGNSRGRHHGRRFRKGQEPVRCVGDVERDRVRVHRGCAEYDDVCEGQ